MKELRKQNAVEGNNEGDEKVWKRGAVEKKIEVNQINYSHSSIVAPTQYLNIH